MIRKISAHYLYRQRVTSRPLKPGRWVEKVRPKGAMCIVPMCSQPFVRTSGHSEHRVARAGQHDSRFPTALSSRADLLGQKIVFR